MARPTDYTKELVKKAIYYLNNHEECGDAVPSVSGLSKHLEIARSTIYDWNSQEDKKEFSDILEKIISNQENLLINKGLKNEFNSAIVKLMLGKHGYSEKQETDITTQGEKLGVVILPKKYESSLESPKKTGTST